MRFLLIVLLAFIMVRLSTSCDNSGRTETAGTENGEATETPNRESGEAPGSGLSPQQHPQFNSARVQVRGNDRLSVFTLPAALVFTAEKNEISLDAKQDLKGIAEVIKERYPQGRVYVYVPNAGGQGRKADGGRAMEVKNWLVVQEGLDEARVFVPETAKQPGSAPVLEEPLAGEVRIVATGPEQ